MPKIAELREIDGAVWARVPMELGSPIQILAPDEIEANSERESGYLGEIERLRAALQEAVSLVECYGLVAKQIPGDPMRAGRWIGQAREALGTLQQSGDKP